MRRILVGGVVLSLVIGSAAGAKTPAAGPVMDQATLASFHAYLVRASAWLDGLTSEQRERLTTYIDAKGTRYSLAPNGGDGLPPEQWALMDRERDMATAKDTPTQPKVAPKTITGPVYGTSTNRAYEEFKPVAPKSPVVVAVLDSGVDIDHEDLKDVIWTNPNPTRGDVHGWNFLGNKDGRNVVKANLEETRYLRNLNEKKAKLGLSPSEEALRKHLEEFVGTKRKDLQDTANYYQSILSILKASLDMLHSSGLTDDSPEAVMAFDPSTSKPESLRYTAQLAKSVAIDVLKMVDPARVQGAIDRTQDSLDTEYNTAFNAHDITQDNENDMRDLDYGNANVFVAENAMHATHCSGIIAAVRDNGLGIDGQVGIPAYVRIMPIRAIPDGDERDKDVANGIRYAVDHGAKVVSMSFGKKLSPNKDYVDEAVAYAEKHGVLLVHAAGNDNHFTDRLLTDYDKTEYALENNYPNPYALDAKTGKPDPSKRFSNWIEVGASTWDAQKAGFSNYGPLTVDVFAPGVAIFSSVPGGYMRLSGTSMATPEVAGISALLLTQFPNLTPAQVRQAVMTPGHYQALPQIQQISTSGLVANTLDALKAAKELASGPN